MSKEKALSCFRKPPLRLNCAQAIAYAFGREDLVPQMAENGAGNAPDGLCGALFCAMQIAGEKNAPAISDAFEKKLGQTHCRALKKELAVPCTDCVACAAEILQQAGN